MKTMLNILWLFLFASVGLAGCVPQGVQPADSAGVPWNTDAGSHK
jgi:hypothetical protein